MTEPSQPSRLDIIAGAAEVTGLALLASAGFVLHLAAGLALAGVALFVIGFFGLART